MSSLPVVGAAMTLDEVELHRDWLFEKSRDLELQSFIDAEVLNCDWAPLAARTRRLLDGHSGRLGIHGPFWGFTIASEDPDIRAIVTRRLLQGLDVCAAIGATHMVIHSPYTSWSYNNLDDNAGAREALVERTHVTLRDAVRRAEDIGCTMVIENIEDKDPHIRVALAESFQSPAVAVSIDTGHAHYAHGYTGATTSRPPAIACSMSTCRMPTDMPIATGASAKARSTGTPSLGHLPGSTAIRASSSRSRTSRRSRLHQLFSPRLA